MEIDLDTELPFGKHKGKKARDLIDQFDVSYLEWLHHKTDHILSEALKEEIIAFKKDQSDQSSFYRRCRYNENNNRGSSHDACYGQAMDRYTGGI